MKKKILLLASAMMLWGMGFAQVQVPEGYVSISDLYTTDLVPLPINVAGGGSQQLTGPGAGWDLSTEYDLSKYEKLSINLTFDEADAGKMVAFRFAINTAVQAYYATLPAEGTKYSVEIDLAAYANANGETKMGGLVFYNGNGHWALGDPTYQGNKATQPMTVNYIAVKTIAVQGVAVEASDAAVAAALPVGQSLLFKTVFEPVNATNQNVTWVSSDESIATVDATGLVTAVAVGTTAITATTEEGAFVGTCDVTVAAVAVSAESVSLNLAALEMKKPMVSTLVATVLPAVAANKTITWSSSNPEVATVADGVITAVSAGTTTITVTTEDGGFTDECVVTINEFATVPDGYVSIYPLDYNFDGTIEAKTEIAPVTMPVESNIQFFGPGSGWGDAWKNYGDFSAYTELKIRLSYDYEDGGRQCFIRLSYATSTEAAATDAIPVNLPEGETTYDAVIDLSKYAFTGADDASKVYLGGILFYTGTHAYGGTPYTKERVTKPVYIDYIAAKENPTGIANTQGDDAPVDVYSIQGIKIRSQVKSGDALNGLQKGIYIVNGKKVSVL